MLNIFNNCKPISTIAADLFVQKCKRPAQNFDILPTQAKKAAIQTNSGQNKHQSQAQLTEALITAAQKGDKTAMEKLCIFYEPLFRKEMRREIFYKTLGFDEGLSLARLKFIELVLTYNGADYEHFPGYVRCRIHFALYDEVKKIWADENKKAPLPQTDEAESALTDNVIEREELSILLNQALAKLTPKQRTAIISIYLNGHSNKETAQLLNCTPAMVTKHHKLALKNLKSKIA